MRVFDNYRIVGNENFDLVDVDVPTHYTYYCGNGYSTDDYADAKAHGYKNNSRSFEQKLELADFSRLPVAEDFWMMVIPSLFYPGRIMLGYMNKEDLLMYNPCEYLEYLVLKEDVTFYGTVREPYEFFAAYTQFAIFDWDDYVVILDYYDIGSSRASGFKVPKQLYYSELKEFIDYVKAKQYDWQKY